METLDYKKYYNLENYLRQTVHETFHKNGCIDASDFFCIIIWKANRAKSKIANKLYKVEPNLELCCKQLTQRLFQSKSHKDRLKLLVNNYKFRLPMSSAILSIFYPDDFSVYDVRVCETLPQFSNLVYTTNFENLWVGYSNYIKAVKDFHPIELSLVDKDHLMWGKSFYDQLKKNISSNFK
jgi:hypothetical protein